MHKLKESSNGRNGYEKNETAATTNIEENRSTSLTISVTDG